MRIIDLTLEVYNGLTFPPGIPVYERNPARLELVATQDEEKAKWFRTIGLDVSSDVEIGYLANVCRVDMLMHTGTHIDAPCHFVAKGATAEKLPLEKLVGDAVILNLTHKGADERITADDLEKAGSSVRKGDIVVVRTDWLEKMWGREGVFRHSPYYGPDTADWFLSKKVSAFACDSYNDLPTWHAKPGEGLRPVHNKLLGSGMPLIEWVTNLSRVRQERVKLIALPLKLRGTEAAPARVIAIEE